VTSFIQTTVGDTHHGVQRGEQTSNTIFTPLSELQSKTFSYKEHPKEISKTWKRCKILDILNTNY